MMVTGHLGAVFRTVLETMRTLFVWILGLILFYTPLGMGRLGESWTAWSPLQALGWVQGAARGRAAGRAFGLWAAFGHARRPLNVRELGAALAGAAAVAPAPRHCRCCRIRHACLSGASIARRIPCIHCS
jgi:hypothetical protein